MSARTWGAAARPENARDFRSAGGFGRLAAERGEPAAGPLHDDAMDAIAARG